MHSFHYLIQTTNTYEITLTADLARFLAHFVQFLLFHGTGIGIVLMSNLVVYFFPKNR